MKSEIIVGDAVDTGQGDYLFVAGKKINSNFNDIYYELGDENTLFSAGAWKIVNRDDLKNGVLEVKYGQSLIVNSANSNFKIHLPKGGVENVGKVIKLRDVYGTWFSRPIQIKPFSGDTIKGKSGYTIINKNFSTIELVYTSKARWEYVATTQIDKLASEDNGSVVSKDFIAKEGQTDFPVPFESERYNPQGIEVFRRGNKLYYGDTFNENSEYGSIGKNGELVELDGLTIKLKHPCKAGDTISFTSYLDGIETFRTSKNKRVYKVIDTDLVNIPDTPSEDDIVYNAIHVNSEKYETDETGIKHLYVSLESLGIQSYDNFNPYTIDISLNGVMLVKLGEYNNVGYVCSGTGDVEHFDSPFTCEEGGGKWVPNGRDADYNLVFSGSSVVGIEFNIELHNDDIVSFVWYHNIIGTTLSVDEIKIELDKSFLNTTDEFIIRDQIKIPNYEDISGLPSQSDVLLVDEEKTIRPNNVSSILNMVYPIGHIYMNYFNKTSPEYTLGFGVWRRLSGHVLAGFSEDYSDITYGQNHDYLDNSGQPTATTGGSVGSPSHKLTSKNIPLLETEREVLVMDRGGDIDIGACLVDPDDEELSNPKKYSESKLHLGNIDSEISAISNLQPTKIVSMWVRVG